ncbi:LytR/AlgR family response regulator transcription factor [Confluentibacter sediminis]|uniref:LytR/AlgR family response regulator transcription factor n=1 Tax=Confluentibacter sediminis TaxID=2219045 RepID=UPI000DAD700B|nr:LytTR family DNA-binding domain-containing protein [Confluentibacter sediminis]
MVYKCIIVDDEEPARILLNDYSEKIDGLEVIGVYKSPLDCLAVLEKEEIDILFLDINMPDISGIDFLKSLSQKPKVILTTAYREYAVEGFELEVTDYILKPIEFHRFLKAVNKAKKEIDKHPSTSFKKESAHKSTKSVQLKSNKKLFNVNYNDITYIQSHNEYVMYHTSIGNLIVYGTMKSVKDSLPENFFFRIHRSFIVNAAAIKYVEGNQIVLLNNQKLPIGESYKVGFLSKWK